MREEVASAATELFLIFPPQWSPFQPPLSLPSIIAWLRRRGFSVKGADANIALYHWLFSDKAVRLLKAHLRSTKLSPDERAGCEAILTSAVDFKADITRLQGLGQSLPKSDEKALKAHFYSLILSIYFWRLYPKLWGR
jgi:hypothetical protein